MKYCVRGKSFFLRVVIQFTYYRASWLRLPSSVIMASLQLVCNFKAHFWLITSSRFLLDLSSPRMKSFPPTVKTKKKEVSVSFRVTSWKEIWNRNGIKEWGEEQDNKRARREMNHATMTNVLHNPVWESSLLLVKRAPTKVTQARASHYVLLKIPVLQTH